MRLRAFPGYEFLTHPMPGYRRIARMSCLDVLRALRVLRGYWVLIFSAIFSPHSIIESPDSRPGQAIRGCCNRLQLPSRDRPNEIRPCPRVCSLRDDDGFERPCAKSGRFAIDWQRRCCCGGDAVHRGRDRSDRTAGAHHGHATLHQPYRRLGRRPLRVSAARRRGRGRSARDHRRARHRGRSARKTRRQAGIRTPANRGEAPGWSSSIAPTCFRPR